jgi:hypothetical protein
MTEDKKSRIEISSSLGIMYLLGGPEAPIAQVDKKLLNLDKGKGLNHSFSFAKRFLFILSLDHTSFALKK